MSQTNAPPLQSVPLWRIRAAVAEAGLMDAANAAVAARGFAAVQWWEYGSEVERSHPGIAALGLPDEQIDALFLRAAEIEP